MFKRLLRPDGSVIIFLPKKDTQAVTFEVWYKVGSYDEKPSEAGVSHFVEHLMFKGTTKRPKTIDISKELDSVGAEFNAFTGKEYTGYFITADSTHLSLAIEVLADMLHNSKFDPEEINRERGVITEEINMYEDNPIMYIEDIFENLLYQGTPLGQPIIGSRQNIKTVKRDVLYNYYKKNYQPGRTIIGVAGNFSESKALALINKLFPIGQTKARFSRRPAVVKQQKQPRLKIIKRDLGQVQLALGFPSVASTHPQFLVGQVLANALGGMMSSRLFLEIREKHGLCYSINSTLSGYQDGGAFTVQAGLNKDKIYQALSAIKEELEKARTKGISPAELRKAKDNIRGHLILRLENASNHLGLLLWQEIIGKKIKDLPERLRELERINLSAVNNFAQKAINWSQANLAIIGPFQSKDKFLKILSSRRR